MRSWPTEQGTVQGMGAFGARRVPAWIVTFLEISLVLALLLIGD